MSLSPRLHNQARCDILLNKKCLLIPQSLEILETNKPIVSNAYMTKGLVVYEMFETFKVKVLYALRIAEDKKMFCAF